jgi:hypothetical protein
VTQRRSGGGAEVAVAYSRLEESSVRRGGGGDAAIRVAAWGAPWNSAAEMENEAVSDDRYSVYLLYSCKSTQVA